MKTFRDSEKCIDDIREQLYREMQDLGEDEFNKRQAIKVREAAEKYGFKIVPTKSVRRAI
ncbi:MAG: hypothetical protein FWD16_06080 [Clostridia bacterium]|nr:hypothetical protein [Clostridia bacterium]